MSTVSPERLLLPGAAGVIETLVESPQAAPRAVAVCCHPHPLFGGTMTNKVIHTVARSFVASNAITIRFNFRGVGLSEGTHAGGDGETEDVIGLAAWARNRWPGLPLWLAGFSFGAWVALRAQSILQPSLLVTVAPGLGEGLQELLADGISQRSMRRGVLGSWFKARRMSWSTRQLSRDGSFL